MNNILFSKVKETAIIPSREYHNAGFDIYPCFEEESMIINSFETVLIPTGIASCFSSDYYMQIQERGSSGSRGIKYSAGVIDSSYRGEWFLATTNSNAKPILITKLDLNLLSENVRTLLENAYVIYPYDKALFQGVLHRVYNDIDVKEISHAELLEIPSSRGDGKLGSSCK